MRRWATLLVQVAEPDFAQTEALAVSALLHVGEEPERLAWARTTMEPRVILFLDEPAWSSSGIVAVDRVGVEPFTVPDPHRLGQSYEGWWATTPDGFLLGKSPQHPAAHKLYRASDLDAFLRSAPLH